MIIIGGHAVSYAAPALVQELDVRVREVTSVINRHMGGLLREHGVRPFVASFFKKVGAGVPETDMGRWAGCLDGAPQLAASFCGGTVVTTAQELVRGLRQALESGLCAGLVLGEQ